MLWLVKIDRWIHAANLCSILKLVYFDSWSWESFVSTCDVFNCLFPLDVQNEIQLLSRIFRYSWLVCLLVFWFRDASLVKVGNPILDGIVFVFHLAWCVLKRVQNSQQAILALLDSFQELHLYGSPGGHIVISFLFFTFPFLFFTFWFSLRHLAFRLRIRLLFFTFPFSF